MSAPHIHTHNCGCAEAAKGLGDLCSLYSQVMHDRVTTLNEEVRDSGRGIIKPYDQRLSNDIVCRSDCDGELLFHIAFASEVRLKALTIRGAAGAEESPTRVKLWVNREDIDFTNANDTKPTQVLDSVPWDETGDMQVPVKLALFSNTSKLTILMDKPGGLDNEGERLSIGYLGFFGVPTSHKHAIVNVVYEARANPADHEKNKADETAPGYAL